MEQAAKTIDAQSVTFATDMARHTGERTVKAALQYLTDPDKQARLALPECAACFYLRAERIGGAAITSRPCGICKEVQTFASTSTDALCPACAKKNDLCRHCGADIKLRPRRQYERRR